MKSVYGQKQKRGRSFYCFFFHYCGTRRCGASRGCVNDRMRRFLVDVDVDVDVVAVIGFEQHSSVKCVN